VKWITLVLVLGAGSLVPWIVMALGNEDVEALESPLVLAVGGQLVEGPWGLYGPYGGRNPLVLIHAPLYYHLAALSAWPMVRVGLGPVPAALVAGRLLSSLGLVATLVAAFQLARLGGASRWAPWWAALLVAATPVFGGLPFEVRPDMLGIGLQTTGVLLLLAALRDERPRERGLQAAFACFGLAVCIKQHFLVAPAISTLLLTAARANGRIRSKAIARVLLTALAIVVLCYGVEEWGTAGRMSRSVFVAALRVGRFHPADWYAAGNIFLALIWKCVGMILLAAAAVVRMVSTRPGKGRRLFAAAGTALIAVIVGLTILQFFVVRMGVSVLIVAGLIFTMCLMIVVLGLTERRSLLGDRVDGALWALCAGELALTALLCRLSTGAWYNYAIQAVVFGSVLVARALARSFDCTPSPRPVLAAVLAVLAVPAFAFTDAKEIIIKRRADRALLARLLDRVQRPSSELFFVDRPGDNRVHGRLDLVYDSWLYPVFESIGLAEPRSVWLARALEAGPVRVVVTTSNLPMIDGIPRTLEELGYRAPARVGPFFVWVRRSRVFVRMRRPRERPSLVARGQTKVQCGIVLEGGRGRLRRASSEPIRPFRSSGLTVTLVGAGQRCFRLKVPRA